ncbi:MAG: hypothetical protein IKU03_02570 [Bacteroidales bacterium]|nr:hypothetical protein [Bacteroidales bacterium]
MLIQTPIRKVNILLCDTFPGLLPEYIPSYESMFVNLFHAVNYDITFEVFRVLDGELPDYPAANEIHLITGSNNAAYDDTLMWILNLQDWVRKAAIIRVPLVGICFGHQIIAQALGGRVERYAGGWGVGIRESQILDEELRTFFPDGRLRLIVNHHDQVMQLPEGASPLATSNFCRYEGFRIGHHILTFQGHPEFPVDYERHLILNHSENEDDGVKQQALKSLEEMDPQGEAVARFLCMSFHIPEA